MSELTLAYKFKFVWAPFLDQYDEKRRQAEAAGKMVLPSLRSPEFERFMREAKEALSEDGAAPFSRRERKRR